MIGKIQKGRGFKGVVSYAMDRKEARLIDSEGVLTDSKNSIIRSFIAQTQLNEDVKQPVEHIVLSYKKEDELRLTDAKMAELAREYLQEMKLVNTQFIVIRHHDRDHPHCHIVLNRIDNNGKLLSDKHDKLQNMTVCKRLKLKHNLTFGENKANVNLDRLRKPERAQHEIYHALTAALKTAKSWRELRKELAKSGITIEYKFRGKTTEIQGINFLKDGFNYRGSKIDRNYSYSKLDARLKQNHIEDRLKLSMPKSSESTHQHNDKQQDWGLGGILDISPNPGSPEHEETLDEAEAKRRKKKKPQYKPKF